MYAKPSTASPGPMVTFAAACLATVVSFTILWSVVALFLAPQAALTEAPAKRIDAVLPKERLAAEHERRHAPVA